MTVLATLHPQKLSTRRPFQPFQPMSRSVHPFVVVAPPSHGLKRFASHSCDTRSPGFWRDSLPPPEEMQNGRWVGKGRCFAFAQVMETLLGSSAKRCAWRRMRADRYLAEETARRQREWEEKGSPESGSGGFDQSQFKRGQWRSAEYARDRCASDHWQMPGTKAGPFDPAGFKREHWRATMGGYSRYSKSSRFRPHHHRNRLPVENVVLSEQRHRYKTGLFYFLTTRVPQSSPEYKQSILPRTRPTSETHRFVAPPRHVPVHPQASTFFAQSAAASLGQHSRAYNTGPASQQHDHHHHRTSHHSLYKTAVLRIPVVCNMRGSSKPAGCFTKAFSTAINALRPIVTTETCDPCAHLMAGLPILWPLVTILKSTSALNAVTWASRIALTLLPLSVRAKIIHVVKERYFADPEGSAWIKRVVEMRGGTTPNSVTSRINATFILPALLLLPVALLGATVLASYERTPITGRPRIVMLSPTEEENLVHNILSLGTAGAVSPVRDWVTILQNVLQLPDEGISTATGRRIFLGGEVLDERDWRVRWTQAVLVALEAGVPSLTANGAAADCHADGILSPPPTHFPLTARPASGEGRMAEEARALVADYDLLVLDRQESNAFSFGFGPDEADSVGFSKGKKGVIVVYSGFIDEILGRQPTAAVADMATPASGGFFSSFLSARRPPPSSLANETPDVMPTPEQTKSLAVLLSHELSHLILSHTLESYASTSVLIPHVSKMLADVARTLIFPITAIFGPFVSDAIGRTMNEGAGDGFGVSRAVNSCESRRLELEADVVALRLLSHSGIDPRHALHFWEERLVASSHPDASSSVPVSEAAAQHLRLHSPATQASKDKDGKDLDPACGFLRSHPVNEERVERIKAELEHWMSLLTGPVHSLRSA